MSNQESSFFELIDLDYDGVIYLASPYTHTFPEVEELRYSLACRAVKEFTLRGCVAISPIVHCHPVRRKYNLPGDAKFWGKFCKTLLKNCNAMRVLRIPGWFSSSGVSEEIALAHRYQIPVDEVYLRQEIFERIELAWN